MNQETITPTKKQLPPSVPRLLSILNTMRFVRNPVPVINDAMEKYGDTYSFHLGGIMHGVISSNPSFIQHFLQKNNRNYKKKSKLFLTTVK